MFLNFLQNSHVCTSLVVGQVCITMVDNNINAQFEYSDDTQQIDVEEDVGSIGFDFHDEDVDFDHECLD